MTGWTLDGQAILYPQRFKVEEVDVAYTDTVSSGKMVVDTVNQKNRYRLEYDHLTLAEVAVFQTIRQKRDFVSFTFKWLGVNKIVSVWMHPMTYEGETQLPETWINFRIILEERG